MFNCPSCIVVSYTVAKMNQQKTWTTHDFCTVLVLIPSSDRTVVRNEPVRADFLFSSSLLWETEQKDQQEEAIYFHNATYTVQHTHEQCSTLQ